MRQFAYHGYWPLDFTITEPRFGTETEFHELVQAAHRIGLKVYLDVVIGHCGYPDLETFRAYLPEAVLPEITDDTCPTVRADNRFLKHCDETLAKWWGPSWILAPLSGHTPGGLDDLTLCYHGLPRFRLDNNEPVQLPYFLSLKGDTRSRNLPDTTVKEYLINWLVRWVAEHGVDGFRCDSAKHVPLTIWTDLRQAACGALAEWRRTQAHDESPPPFWMVGEVFGYGLGQNVPETQGFDSLINFEFQTEAEAILAIFDDNDSYLKSLALFRLDKLYVRYADFVNVEKCGVLSYLSSHDTYLFERSKLKAAATLLMLAPGGVAIYYGDEIGRLPDPDAPDNGPQAARSAMDWSCIDGGLLSHWKALGSFRKRHPAVGAGMHQRLSEDPYVFSRQLVLPSEIDRIIVCIGVRGLVKIPVSTVFEDGENLYDAYSQSFALVSGGVVELHARDLVLLESAADLNFGVRT